MLTFSDPYAFQHRLGAGDDTHCLPGRFVLSAWWELLTFLCSTSVFSNIKHCLLCRAEEGVLCELVFCPVAGGSSGSVFVNRASVSFAAYPASGTATFRCQLEVLDDATSVWGVQSAFSGCTSPKVL